MPGTISSRCRTYEVPETVMPGEDSRHHLFFKRIGNFFIHPEIVSQQFF
jgi:hypothetical protein